MLYVKNRIKHVRTSLTDLDSSLAILELAEEDIARVLPKPVADFLCQFGMGQARKDGGLSHLIEMSADTFCSRVAHSHTVRIKISSTRVRWKKDVTSIN